MSPLCQIVYYRHEYHFVTLLAGLQHSQATLPQNSYLLLNSAHISLSVITALVCSNPPFGLQQILYIA